MDNTSELEEKFVTLFHSAEFQIGIILSLLLLLSVVFFAIWVNHLLNKRAQKNAGNNASTEICEKVVLADNQTEEGVEPSERKIGCLKCGGHYVLRHSSYGYFGGCSNFPKCTSTLKIRDYIKRIIDEYGIRIYAWEKQCYRCKRKTTVCSYYLAYDYRDLVPILEQCCEIGIGDIPSLDKLVLEKYPNIQNCYSKTTRTIYIANVCSYCHALQGHNYVVDDPEEIYEDLVEKENIEQYFVGTIMVADEKVMSDIADTIMKAMGL